MDLDMLNIKEAKLLVGAGMDEIVLYTNYVPGITLELSESQVFRTFVRPGTGKEYLESLGIKFSIIDVG